MSFTFDPADLSYCPDCSAKMAGVCGICTGPVMPNEEVALYVLTDERRAKLPLGATIYKDNLYVCCKRCAEMGPADYAALWIPPGIVKEVPFEELVDIVAG